MIMALPGLSPSYQLSELYPDNTGLGLRSSLDLVRWVTDDPLRLDSTTGHTITVMGDMPLICHKNVLTSVVIRAMESAGLRPPETSMLYETEAEAIAVAEKAMNAGVRKAYVYPPSHELHKHEGLLFPVSLYNWLNDKANLAEMVDAKHLPKYDLFPKDKLESLHDFLSSKTVFIKACHAGASGSGVDVRFCETAEDRKQAEQWLRTRLDTLSAVRVEEAVNVSSCWCMNLAVIESEVIYLGAATQVFSAPAKQSGSRIDPDDLPSDAAIEVALDSARRAHELGFRGVAGFDIGVDASGHVYVFDLNFRLAACTPQILLHKAATERVGASISQSWSGAVKGGFSDAFERIEPLCREGVFVPIRIFDAEGLHHENSLVSGFVVGKSAEEIEMNLNRLNLALGDLLVG